MRTEEDLHIPSVTDADIAWVRGLMGLRGLDLPREAFLRRLSTVDVSACPGSGKTTLVVAKLALLARYWPWQSRGICVLSHTNVAREEIETRLGPTPVGHLLRGYPHHFSTIHSFLGHFLAEPYLHTHGKAFLAFDNDLTYRARQRVMGKGAGRLETDLERKYKSLHGLRIQDVAYTLAPFLKDAAPDLVIRAQKAVRGAAEDGYFCFDDVFILAEALLDEVPEVAEILRGRFPFVMIDEMQDTETRQGRLLAKIFPRDREDLCVQRVGDPNQAIFTGHDETGDDSFPDPLPERRLGISDSFRFGQKIASASSPLAVASVQPEGLKGVGPGQDVSLAPQPVILFFQDSHPEDVLPAFGDLVIQAFPDDLLAKGTVAAVGAVHKAFTEPDPNKFPQSVCHYWGSYAPSGAKKGGHPETLAEYVLLAQQRAARDTTFGEAAKDLAFGLFHLVRLMSGGSPGTCGRSHRRLLEHLEASDATSYTSLLVSLFESAEPLTSNIWEQIKSRMLGLAGKLGGKMPLTDEANVFLAWPERLAGAPAEVGPAAGPQNVYRHEAALRRVDIRLGSIHSVKGETHLATLVLEVYHYTFVLDSMLTFLRNAPPAKKKPSLRDKAHRRLAYVAMTRPTHMLCLAMRASSLGAGAEAEQMQAGLEAQGWRVIRVGACGPPSERSSAIGQDRAHEKAKA